MRPRPALYLVALLLASCCTPSVARASGPPLIGAEWASAVGSGSAKLSAEVDPNGSFTSYHFEYLSEAAYQANGGGFAGALRSPSSGEASLGLNPLTVSQTVFSLAAETTYRYRVVAQNSNLAGPSRGAAMSFTTKGPGPALLDGRGWEMVSPVDKNGGQIDPPGAIAAGGALQAAADGGSVTYGSTASFAGGLGGPQGNQYISRRTSEGWTTENITAPIGYQSVDGGVPYRLFSADLGRGILQNGDHCASGQGQCTVGNPPLDGTDAPPGYQDYYLRESSTGAYIALIGAPEAAELDLAPGYFDVYFAGASPDLAHVILSSCAALTPGATEVPSGSGCVAAEQNLYEWSASTGLSLINGATPGAALAAQAGAVSDDGSRVYFYSGGDLFVKEGGTLKSVDADAGGGGTFQLASADGTLAYFTKGGDLWRFAAATDSATKLTSSADVQGVLGAAASGERLYYLRATGLYLCQGAASAGANGCDAATKIADDADASNYPPATGTSRVSADGTKLLFLSTAPLTGYDNVDSVSGDPDTEVFLYDASSPSLRCVSCNPTNGRPLGPSTIPGAVQNGTAAGFTQIYRPRALSADGRRVFFDSGDSIALTDTNQDHTTGAGKPDVYEWEAQGEGGCTRSGGCVSLISSGRSAGGAVFVDASADGADAFFITDDSLVPSDPGAVDLYDARVGGGFPVPSPSIPCEGDACQPLPSPPGDPTLTTLLSGHGNPPEHYVKYRRHAKKKRRKHHGRRHGHRHEHGNRR